jgi:hypothetical protein
MRVRPKAGRVVHSVTLLVSAGLVLVFSLRPVVAQSQAQTGFVPADAGISLGLGGYMSRPVALDAKEIRLLDKGGSEIASIDVGYKGSYFYEVKYSEANVKLGITWQAAAGWLSLSDGHPPEALYSFVPDLKAWVGDEATKHKFSRYARQVALAGAALSDVFTSSEVVPGSAQDPTELMAALDCNGVPCVGRAYNFRKSVACQNAIVSSNQCCTNRLCWGCCSRLPCDCYCAPGGDFYCFCSVLGIACN